MADAGSLASFTDFMTATREQPLGGPNEIKNQMTRFKRYASRLILSGLQADDYFQGGKKIVDQFQLKYTANFAHYAITDTHNPQGDDSLVTLEVPWRFSKVHSVTYEQEIELNDHGDQTTTFKKLKKAKRQKMFTDFWDGVEDTLFADPHTDMEGGNSTGTKPYSLRAIFTKAGGMPTTTDDGANSNFTTLYGVSTSTYPNWECQTENYDAASPETTLLDALDEMWLKVSYESPPEQGDSKTGMVDTPMRKQRIITNTEGYKLLVKLAREGATGNKQNANLGEFNGKVFYNQMKIDRLDALDDVFTAGEPQFWFANFNHIKLFFHKGHFLKAKTFDGTVNQPNAYVEYRDTWWNLLCTNRREQGVVSAA